ncbi:unnamed protein product [Protopolystoma xenopodis]|uniref:Uncharacterized protein n=1 Tax=Protopolystoma xenopodis TaxID=117903 RepID=A0A3S5BD04_9PLAT|nr:unnamed protein product [Protopolystoma xenopodis]
MDKSSNFASLSERLAFALSSFGFLECRGAHKICQHFYDTPPAGRYGTMAYMVRALAHLVDASQLTGPEGLLAVNCNVQ